jgi:chromosome segregation protein
MVDLEKGIVDLEKIVDELDTVIKKQFDSSFKKINESFEHYFTKIFEGGKAKLTLIQKEKAEKEVEGQTEADLAMAEGQENAVATMAEEAEPEKETLALTGVDIFVSPPNKKLSTISILSGGEKTMTSLALLCAIIDCNPAPFVVMDEVEAALDEANSERFAAILQELSYKTQFVIITHNRVIMHVADVLYGVAMGDDGVSKTLSLDLQEAEKNIKK